MNITYNPPSARSLEILKALREAVAKELEKKRRLGHYAVFWSNGQNIFVDVLSLDAISQAGEEATLVVIFVINIVRIEDRVNGSGFCLVANRSGQDVFMYFFGIITGPNVWEETIFVIAITVIIPIFIKVKIIAQRQFC